MEIGRLRRLNLRDVWPHEAHDFTTWLEENIDLLNECLPIDLDSESVRREEAAGAFSVDLVVEDSNGEAVVIENQLEKSDHNHLGKVLTYLSQLNAKTAIWIVSDPRPEHVNAVSWLNESNLAAFYLLKIEVVQIGDSAPAPVLTQIVGPTDSTGQIASVRQEISDRGVARKALFAKFIEAADEYDKTFAGRTPPAGPYLGASSGIGGVQYVFGMRGKMTSVILWIEKGKAWGTWNETVYEKLLERREEIESTFGHELEWEAVKSNRSRKLIFRIQSGGWKTSDLWDEVTKLTVDEMVKFRGAIDPLLKEVTDYADQHSPKESDSDEDQDQND